MHLTAFWPNHYSCVVNNQFIQLIKFFNVINLRDSAVALGRCITVLACADCNNTILHRADKQKKTEINIISDQKSE